MLLPGIAVAAPSVLVMDRSAREFCVSVSVAELLAGLGSVTPVGFVAVAVFTRLPVRLEGTVNVSMYVAVPPLFKFTVSAIALVPLAVHVDPALAAQVHAAVMMPVGNGSL